MKVEHRRRTFYELLIWKPFPFYGRREQKAAPLIDSFTFTGIFLDLRQFQCIEESISKGTVGNIMLWH